MHLFLILEKDKDIKRRKCQDDIVAYTIDSETTRDIDDAICIDTNYKNGFHLLFLFVFALIYLFTVLIYLINVFIYLFMYCTNLFIQLMFLFIYSYAVLIYLFN